ncbi:MAG: helix-turn-helix domain-containing protein [Sporocytophaga sp.]|uniref:GlxA family transcriptional regulator n=1 Tax=Sporocytophaga sp. TaxID=2231183 RepID=UPI001B11CC77|nr:helix-turn-helix domain-containing protein [Sporocytophaga sp.]MBO9698865.1 helix-turn-helix domain-containing protein [Sporocytophaga sp.]
MKKISILVPIGAVLGSIEGPRQVFSEVNKHLIRLGKEPMFEIKLTGLTKEVSITNDLYKIHPDKLISEISKTDLIIIPAIDGDIKSIIELNRDYYDWVTEHYHKGAEVASLCVGAFLLASTGLLKGKSCATHWLSANEFKKMFPDVRLVEDKIITDENGIYSSGGAFSYLNLILYLVEKYAGRDIALFMARAFQIDIERRSQSPFIIFNGQKDHEDLIVKKAQELIESNPGEKYSVDQIALKFAIGRRNLERRFKKATSNTIIEYVQRVRIEAAKQNLETTANNVNEVMYGVGYSDPKAFRMTFKKYTGMSPIQYRAKYNKEYSMNLNELN